MSPEVVAQLAPYGPVVVLVAMLFFSDREKRQSQAIVREQIEDKKLMREDRTKLEEIIASNAAMLARMTDQLSRNATLLERMERRLNFGD